MRLFRILIRAGLTGGWILLSCPGNGGVFPSPPSAEGKEIELSGYLKNMSAASEGMELYQAWDLFPDDWLLDNYTQLRLEGRLDFKDFLKVSLDYEILSSAGDTRLVSSRVEEGPEPGIPTGFSSLMPGGGPENIFFNFEDDI